MNMTEFEKIQVGDAVNVKIATMSGWVKGWKIVKKVNRSFLEIRAQGTNEFIVKPSEILGVVPKGNVPDFHGKIKAERAKKNAAAEMFTALDWITRCAHMTGPCDTKAYFISDEWMEKAKTAVRHAKGEA